MCINIAATDTPDTTASTDTAITTGAIAVFQRLIIFSLHIAIQKEKARSGCLGF